MTSILDQLFYGNIIPLENIRVDTAEYRALVKEQARRYEDLRKELGELDDGLRRSLDRLMDSTGGPHALVEAAIFRQAFCLGARIMLEVLEQEP